MVSISLCASGSLSTLNHKYSTTALVQSLLTSLCVFLEGESHGSISVMIEVMIEEVAAVKWEAEDSAGERCPQV